MRAHLAYLKYVLRHKWFVAIGCRKFGVPLWRAVIHDWSKFLPAEWPAYVHTFYKADGSKHYVESSAFAAAWNHHQKTNPHHWQYWLLTWDRGETEALPMPMTYVREMLADWYGAGRAITGSTDPRPWYRQNDAKIKLHESTRQTIEMIFATWLP